MTRTKTLIVGGGVTGAALARLLHEATLAAQYASDVMVWDRNSILGGRVMARSFRNHRHVHVDMGAQYWTPQLKRHDDLRHGLIQSEWLAPFPANEIAQDPYEGATTTHWICPNDKGFRAMVEHFLKDTPTKLSMQVASFQVLDGVRIEVSTNAGEKEIVNELVLTCPIPNVGWLFRSSRLKGFYTSTRLCIQVLSILEQSRTFHVAPDLLHALERVTYSQRFAAAYVFDETVTLTVQELGWTAKYVSHETSDIIRFICWDHLKKPNDRPSQPALLVHTSVTFGTTFMDDPRSNDAILAVITQALRNVVPSLPTELEARLHRWRVSQVTVPFADPRRRDGDTAVPVLQLSSSPRILVAGDCFRGSNLDSCLTSATAAAKLLQAQ